jgi:hypothetical protein
MCSTKKLKNWIKKWRIELSVLIAIVIADVLGSSILGRATSVSFWFRMGIGIGAIMALCIIRFMLIKPGKSYKNALGDTLSKR